MNWTAIGTVLTGIGSLATAATVLIYLKPYRKKIIFFFGMQGNGDENEYYLSCFNDGKNIYCSSIYLIHKKRIVVHCINWDMPLVIKRETEYKYTFNDEEIETIRYYITTEDITKFDIELYDVAGRKYKGKLDVKAYSYIAKEQCALERGLQ